MDISVDMSMDMTMDISSMDISMDKHSKYKHKHSPTWIEGFVVSGFGGLGVVSMDPG